MDEKLRRRELLKAALLVAAAGPLAACATRETAAHAARPALLDAVGTAEAISSGQLTALQAVDAAIGRAEAVEPRINAIVTEAFGRARAAARGALDGPLAGVPTFIKDLDDVRGLPTHSGSRSFGRSPATGQGPYVDALEKSGLVFLGKSATPEFGLTSTTEPLFGGPARNPWNIELQHRRLVGGRRGAGGGARGTGRTGDRWRRIDPRACVLLWRVRLEAVARPQRAARTPDRAGGHLRQPRRDDLGA